MKTLAKSSLTNPGVFLALTFVALALWLSPATAQMPDESMGGDGLIIRIQSADLVFIDRGSDHGMTRGELFDIVSSEMLVHPRTDSILAVTPKTVGALRILQVYPLTSLARLVQLDRGEDPMLKPISLVRDAERIAEIEKQMMRGVRIAAGMDVSRRVAVIPGVYQIGIGDTRKGWAILATDAACLFAGMLYKRSSNDWLDEYRALSGQTPSTYDRYWNEAQDRNDWSRQLYWLSVAIYIYSWVDVLWLGDAVGMAYQESPARGLQAGLDFGSNGSKPLLRLTHRF